MLSQYANSPRLMSLATNLSNLYDDSLFTADWFDKVFNMATATGYGLDIWGKILNRSREFIFNGTRYYLQGEQTIGAVHYTAEQMEDLYRKVLQMTAMRYIGNASLGSINKILNVIFGDKGRAYCTEDPNNPMQIRYYFNFYVDELLEAIIRTLNMHPSGVLTNYEFLPIGEFLGFNAPIDSVTQTRPYTPLSDKSQNVENGPFYR